MTTTVSKSTFRKIDRTVSDLDETYTDHFGIPYRNSAIKEPWFGYDAAAETLCASHGWTYKEYMSAFISGSHRN